MSKKRNKLAEPQDSISIKGTIICVAYFLGYAPFILFWGFIYTWVYTLLWLLAHHYHNIWNMLPTAESYYEPVTFNWYFWWGLKVGIILVLAFMPFGFILLYKRFLIKEKSI